MSISGDEVKWILFTAWNPRRSAVEKVYFVGRKEDSTCIPLLAIGDGELSTLDVDGDHRR